MSKSNGTPPTFGGAKIIERVLSNGITVRTSPLSPYASARFMRLAEEQYPDADKKPFLHEHPDSVLSVLDEPSWNAAQLAVLRARRSSWSELVIGACCEVIGDAQMYIDAYAPQIARLRKRLELPEDPWEATLLYGILENTPDINALIDDAQGTTPLTGGEVEDGLRMFRPEVQQPTPGNA